MKAAMLASFALVLSSAAAAQTTGYDPVPPGDGVTRQGTNPEGQACTPAGFNQSLNAYPACSAMGGPAPALEEYPPCTRQVKDRCVQTYTRWTG